VTTDSAIAKTPLLERIRKPQYFKGWIRAYRRDDVEELETALRAGVLELDPELLEGMNKAIDEDYGAFYNWYCGFYASLHNPHRYKNLYIKSVVGAINIAQYQGEAGVRTNILLEIGGVIECLKYQKNKKNQKILNEKFLELLVWRFSISKSMKKEEIMNDILETEIMDGLLFMEMETQRKIIRDRLLEILEKTYTEQQNIVDKYKKSINELLETIILPLLETRKQTLKRKIKERQNVSKEELIMMTNEPVREWNWCLSEEEKEEMAEDLGISPKEYKRLLLETSVKKIESCLNEK
jgi:hypothetical protein